MYVKNNIRCSIFISLMEIMSCFIAFRARSNDGAQQDSINVANRGNASIAVDAF